MSAGLTFAIDPELDACLRAEAVGQQMPLALRRFVEHWEAADLAMAVRRTAESVLKTYSEQFPSPSPVIRVGRLCHVVGARLEGLRPAQKTSPVYAVAGGPRRHAGHSGSVRFSPEGVPCILVPEGIDGYRARVAAAHEIGHILVHQRHDGYDLVTVRLAASLHEEAIAEYIARVLLLPQRRVPAKNLAEAAVRWASDTEVTVHAATSRIGDPDQQELAVRGAILWKMIPSSGSGCSVAKRLTPAWHLCAGAFVPIGRCNARSQSLIAEVADTNATACAEQLEEVRIGSLQGEFRVHAFSWGSISSGTRLVLSVFQLPSA